MGEANTEGTLQQSHHLSFEHIAGTRSGRMQQTILHSGACQRSNGHKNQHNHPGDSDGRGHDFSDNKAGQSTWRDILEGLARLAICVKVGQQLTPLPRAALSLR